jgi:hypothetical protein
MIHERYSLPLLIAPSTSVRFAAMMRINWGLSCALAVGIAACAASSNSSPPDAAPTCGDGICAASEIDTCPQDCGTPGSGAVVDAGSGLGIDAGSALGVDAGSGSGLDCSSETVIEDCVVCLAINACGSNEAACETCLGG